jgi:hypothetical protein
LLSQKLDRKINNLATFNTPVRLSYKFNESNIGRHVQLFSYLDGVQPFGGGMMTMVNGVRWGEFGPAGHKISNDKVTNINFTDYQIKDTMDAIKRSSIYNPIPFYRQIIKNHSTWTDPRARELVAREFFK